MSSRFHLGLLVVLGVLHLAAHPLDLGLLEISKRGLELRVKLGLNLDFLSTRLQISAEELKRRRPTKEVFLSLLGENLPRLGQKPCQWVGESELEIIGLTATLTRKAICPEESENFTYKLSLLTERLLPYSFQVISHFREGENNRLFTLTQDKPQLELDLAQPSSFAHIIWVGMSHIGATPGEWVSEGSFHLPDGIDHILFVLALALGASGFWGLLKTVTGFTLGHSLTLALASLGWVLVPSSIVEPIIALSIAVTAFDSLQKRGELSLKWKLATLFGLVHGLGFAGAIRELHLSGFPLLKALLGYNLGVELGQLLILGVIFAFVPLLHTKPRVVFYVRGGLASVIFSFGVLWFVQRSFF